MTRIAITQEEVWPVYEMTTDQGLDPSYYRDVPAEVAFRWRSAEFAYKEAQQEMRDLYLADGDTQ